MRNILFIVFIVLNLAAKAQLPNYIPILVGDKYGFCDSNKKMLMEPEWEDATYFQYPYYKLKKRENKFLFLINTACISVPFTSINRVYSADNYLNYSETCFFTTTPDSLLIYNNYPDSPVIAIPFKSPKGYEISVSTINELRHLYCIIYTPKKQKYFKRLFAKKEAYFHIVSTNGVIYTTKNKISPLGKGYFGECENNRWALFKAELDTCKKLTGYDYFYFSTPDSANTIRAVWYDSVRTEESKMYTTPVFYHYSNSIYFLDSAGLLILNFPYQISLQSQPYFSEEDDLLDYLYRFPYLLTNIFMDENVLLYETPVSAYVKNIVFKDTLTGSWLNLDTGLYYYSVKTKENYIVSKQKSPQKFGILDKNGRVVMPFKYHSLYLITPELIRFSDDSITGIMTLGGNILIQSKNSELFNYNLWQFGSNIIIKDSYFKGYDKQGYRAIGEELIPIDSNELKEITTPKYTPIKQGSNSVWIRNFRADTSSNGDLFVYCDSLLLNPAGEITEATIEFNTIVVLRNKKGHTWVVDYTGQVIHYSKKKRHYRISIPDQHWNVHCLEIDEYTNWGIHRKTITWFNFSGKPHFTELYISEFYGQFAVVSKAKKRLFWYYGHEYGVLNKDNQLIIPTKYEEIKTLTPKNNGPYLFHAMGVIKRNRYRDFSGYEKNLLYNDNGKLLYQDVDFKDCYPKDYAICPFTTKIDGKKLTLFIDHYNTIYHVNSMDSQIR